MHASSMTSPLCRTKDGGVAPIAAGVWVRADTQWGLLLRRCARKAKAFAKFSLCLGASGIGRGALSCEFAGALFNPALSKTFFDVGRNRRAFFRPTRLSREGTSGRGGKG